MSDKHLWEYDHPYYCSDSNYYARGDQQPFTEYENWSDFFDEMENADKDLNLLFRWDWHRLDEEELGWAEEDEYTGDTLQLFFMGQRKGLFFINFVKVTENDEDAVRMYLRGYADKMRKLWDPLLDEARE